MSRQSLEVANLATSAAWLQAYGEAWEAKDAAAFSAAVARQRGIRFAARTLAGLDHGFLAHWSCTFLREETGAPVRLDGIFLVEREPDGLCHTFREWWHSDETG